MNVDNELDPHFLRQFSCLGTTDKDDLVKQLQKLLAGCDLSDATAAFFLEMNNWNLQAAICSYIDFETQYKSPCMTFVSHDPYDLTLGVPPNTKFRKSWRIQNSGAEAWPSGITLTHIEGAQMGVTKLPVPSLAAKETIEFNIDFTSPPEAGIYHSSWRMMTSTGSYFGDMFLVFITVDECDTLAVTQQLHLLSTSQSNDEEGQLS